MSLCDSDAKNQTESMNEYSDHKKNMEWAIGADKETDLYQYRK